MQGYYAIHGYRPCKVVFREVDAGKTGNRDQEGTLKMEPLLTTKQAAEYLGLKPQTLAGWRCNGMSTLKYVKVGSRAVRYRVEDLDEWLNGRTGTHTGQIESE